MSAVLLFLMLMLMLMVVPFRTYTLPEFCREQTDRIQTLDVRLLDFRNLLRSKVFEACK
jgi:hypothetical protein